MDIMEAKKKSMENGMNDFYKSRNTQNDTAKQAARKAAKEKIYAAAERFAREFMEAQAEEKANI